MNYKLLLLAGILVVWGCTNTKDKSDGYGNFEAVTVIVSSEAAGRVIELNVEKGQKIEKGYLSAIIDTGQLALKIKQIEAQQAAVSVRRKSVQAQVQVLEEQKKNLEVNKNRIQAMLTDGAATQKQLDDITGQADVFVKQMEATKTQFSSISSEIEVLETQKTATLDLIQRSRIISPVTGTVLETYVEQGEITAPGKPVFKIANLDELILKVYVSGAQLPGFKIGQTINVLIDKSATENQSLSGTITWISPEAEFTPKIIQTKEERVKLVYAVKVKVKNDGRLKIGMPGEIKL